MREPLYITTSRWCKARSQNSKVKREGKLIIDIDECLRWEPLGGFYQNINARQCLQVLLVFSACMQMHKVAATSVLLGLSSKGGYNREYVMLAPGK